MVSRGMKRYRIRRDEHLPLIGPAGDSPIAPAALFGRSAPLRLEIGCGHGEFIAALAASHPEEDLLGVEHDPLRVTKIAHKCWRAGAGNVRLFEGDAAVFVRRLPVGCMHRCYVLFPDPWPKLRHRRRRLLDYAFLLDLARALAPGGRLVIASDHHGYAFATLTNLSLLSALLRNRFLPAGYRFDEPVRFPTVFQRHREAAGFRICQLMCERTAVPAPPAVARPAARRAAL
jgi:tRNA (guanine-N7-)-methyltransferase